ncbi:MAG: endonuclease domain-containing protein [Legionellaceae bacterium]|nr:endonuclease domain-containing protein [Legionellaceae bacterium]
MSPKERAITKSRILRKTSTSTELKLWEYLRNRRFQNLKFRRQHPMGPYVVDFLCLTQKLIIELDGYQHLEQVAYDQQRSSYLEHLGFRVIRFWNHDVLQRLPWVLGNIRKNVEG